MDEGAQPPRLQSITHVLTTFPVQVIVPCDCDLKLNRAIIDNVRASAERIREGGWS